MRNFSPLCERLASSAMQNYGVFWRYECWWYAAVHVCSVAHGALAHEFATEPSEQSPLDGVITSRVAFRFRPCRPQSVRSQYNV